MKENKNRNKTLFRVIRAYKIPILLGFFLGISLVSGVILANQVIGYENAPSTLAKEILPHPIDDTNKTKNIIETIEIKANQLEGISETDEKNKTKEINEANVPDQIIKDFEDLAEQSISAFNQKTFSVLLVGVDQRPGEKSISNTDMLLVASINTLNGEVTLLSIPRDTQVIIPGYGKEKINAAARLGKGLKTTQVLVEEIIGQPIDGYVLTNFTGFQKIIDTLGGITLTVEKDMYYVTGDKENGVINLKKGTRRLNGTQALQYARFRQDALADISRASRQQAVLKAMEKEFLQVKTLPKLPALISQITKSVETDLSVGQLWSIANLLLRFKNPKIISQTLPGNFLIEDEISYWKVNPIKSRAVVKRLIEEGKTTSVFFQ